MMYVYLEENITKVENIKESIKHSINDFVYLLDEENSFKSLEECKESYIDFALRIRVQMNLLTLAIDDIRSFNEGMILNGSKLPNEKIRPLKDIEFKKELLSHRY